jgi:hypothetical protein
MSHGGKMFFISSTGVTFWSVPAPCQNNHLYGYTVKNEFTKPYQTCKFHTCITIISK